MGGFSPYLKESMEQIEKDSVNLVEESVNIEKAILMRENAKLMPEKAKLMPEKAILMVEKAIMIREKAKKIMNLPWTKYKSPYLFLQFFQFNFFHFIFSLT